MKEKQTTAGKGGHRYYLLQDEEGSDAGYFQPGVHYIGIDATRWYVNRQGNLLTNRIASGTATIDLHGENYQMGLGTYELKEGEHTAPIFDRPLVANRVFRGGQLTLRVFVKVIGKDRLLGILLRDLALTSLRISASAIETATAAGPPAILGLAGKSIVKSVESILEEGANAQMVFDPGGIEINIKPSELRGPRNYILVHRGRELEQGKLCVKRDAPGKYVVEHDGSLLEDGAWCLFKVRRETRFGYPRPWEEEARQIRSDLAMYMMMWSSRGMAKASIEQLLKPTGQIPPSIGDKIFSLIARIREDWALTEQEASYHTTQLHALLQIAQESVTKDQPQYYIQEEKRFQEDLRRGVNPRNRAIESIFEKEIDLLRSVRRKTLVEESVAAINTNYWKNLSHIQAADVRESLYSKIDPATPFVLPFETDNGLLESLIKPHHHHSDAIIEKIGKAGKPGGFDGGGGGFGGGFGGGPGG